MRLKKARASIRCTSRGDNIMRMGILRWRPYCPDSSMCRSAAHAILGMAGTSAKEAPGFPNAALTATRSIGGVAEVGWQYFAMPRESEG